MSYYIVVEGIDGSGKSLQARRLADYIGATLVAEPTKEPIGRLIRDRINAGELEPAVMARLFAADRQDLAVRTIYPLLAAGHDVVSDRNVASSLVYQAEGDTTLEVLWDINTKGSPLPTPDLLLVIDVSVEEATKRLVARDGSVDPFETVERLSLHRERYLKLADYVRWPVVCVDGDGTPEEVGLRVREIVDDLLAR